VRAAEMPSAAEPPTSLAAVTAPSCTPVRPLDQPEEVATACGASAGGRGCAAAGRCGCGHRRFMRVDLEMRGQVSPARVALLLVRSGIRRGRVRGGYVKRFTLRGIAMATG